MTMAIAKLAQRILSVVTVQATLLGAGSQFQAYAASVAPSSFDTTHYAFSKDLAKYVHEGQVRYSRWRKKPASLVAYLRSLADVSPEQYDKLSNDDKKALWVNAYNAFTIKLVLDEYPIKGKNSNYPANSFRQLPDAWEKNHFKVAGRDVTLDMIEHTILRRDFHDSRVHYVVVCAAKGSPNMFRHAFTGKTLDADLDLAKNDFLGSEKNIVYDESKQLLKVSRLFQWFPFDFAPPGCFKKRAGKPPSDEEVIIEYLETNGSAALQKQLKDRERDLARSKARDGASNSTPAPLHLEYLPFDWSLNETDD